MATAKFPLQVILGASDGVSGILGKVEGRLGRFGQKAASVGRKLTIGLSLPILAIGAGALSASADFQTGMNNVAAITRSKGTPAFEALTEQARELGATTQFTAGQAAAGMGILAQSGQDAETILGTLPVTLELAAAGNLELAQSADIATGILASQREGVEKLGLRTDQLVRISQSAKTGVAELGEALNVSGAISKAAGISFESNLAILGKLADGNKKGAEAGLILRRSISRLLKPSAEARSALGALDLSKADILTDDGKIKDFVGLLGQLEKKGATAGQIITIFGEIAGPSILSLLGQGVGAIEELRGSIEGVAATGARAEIAAVRMSGAMGATKAMQSAVEAFGIALGDSGLLEWFTAAANELSTFFRWLSKTSPQVLKWGSLVAAAAAAAGPLLIFIGQIAIGYARLSLGLGVILPQLAAFGATLFGTVIPAVFAWTAALLANPVFWIVGAIVGVTMAVIWLAKNWDKAVAGMKRGFSALLGAAQSALNWIDDKLGALGKFIVPPWLRWVINRFSGGKDADLNIVARDESSAGIAAGAAPVGSFSSSSSSSSIKVDFTNLPAGAEVTRAETGDVPVDLSLGYNLAGAL